MEFVDWIVLGVLLLIVGGAVAYIIREKKKGKRCIGCPDSAACSGHCASCQGCRHKAPKE